MVASAPALLPTEPIPAAPSTSGRASGARVWLRRALLPVAVLGTAAAVLMGDSLAHSLMLGSTDGGAQVGVASVGSGPLWPGRVADARVRVTNEHPYAIEVRVIAPDGAVTSDAGAECDRTGAVEMAATPGRWTVEAHGSLEVTLPDALSMSGGAPDACQGATFTIPLRVDYLQR